MSIDELLGMSVEELEKLTDEQLLERFKPIFDLEPKVPLSELEEATDEPNVKKPRQSKKEKLADLKNQLMKMSFDDDFK